jgi:hypothetical protein
MAPSATEIEPPSQATQQILVKPWSRPQYTTEDLEWAPLTTIDLSRFDEPGGKEELAKQLYDAATRVGFWTVVNSGIDDSKVLRQFSFGNTFFKQSLEEKRFFPCNFAEGEYFGYRENSRWIGDTGVKDNVEMVRLLPSTVLKSLTMRSSTSKNRSRLSRTFPSTELFVRTGRKSRLSTENCGTRFFGSYLSLSPLSLSCRRTILWTLMPTSRNRTIIFDT